MESLYSKLGAYTQKRFPKAPKNVQAEGGSEDITVFWENNVEEITGFTNVIQVYDNLNKVWVDNREYPEDATSGVTTGLTEGNYSIRVAVKYEGIYFPRQLVNAKIEIPQLISGDAVVNAGDVNKVYSVPSDIGNAYDWTVGGKIDIDMNIGSAIICNFNQGSGDAWIEVVIKDGGTPVYTSPRFNITVN